MINLEYKSTEISDPYPIWIVDNFLDESVAQQIKDDWLPNDAPQWNTTRATVSGYDNILEKKMLSISKTENMPPFISSVCERFHSDEFTDLISEITGINGLIKDTTMRWSGMRVMVAGSHQLIHSDARKHPENGLRKEITCLLYLNDDYNKDRDEGCLEIWNDDMTKREHEIEPINNRMVIFQNSDTSYHGVPVVKKDRKAIVFSIMKKADSSDRKFAEFVSRPQDSEDVKKIGKERGMGK